MVELEAGSGGLKRLLGKKGPMRMSLAPAEIVIEHAHHLHAPLRFAPGAVTLASVDPGPAQVSGDARAGRFPILHKLSSGTVVPREEGIEGWLWTSTQGSAITSLCGTDAPNVLFLFTPPLGGPAVTDAFEPEILEEIAKRSPLGEPALFGLLLRVVSLESLRPHLEWLSLGGVLTDREIPPTQRRHLPGDKPANPGIAGAERAGTSGSIPPPGMS